MWNVLPIIRREIAESMIHNFGLNQKETANKLGVTPAAICQYLSDKRGKIRIIDRKVLQQINISANRIMQRGDTIAPSEVCRICKFLRSEKILPFISETASTINIKTE
jgi:predicted transcriptional regulator